MSLVFALLLIVHGSIHIGYICGPAWPFVAGDPWLVTGLGLGADAVRTAGIDVVLVTFVAYLVAAVAATGILRFLWKPAVVVASVASAVVLVAFVTPSTLPGIAIDAVLLWATVVRDWRPAPFFGRARRSATGGVATTPARG